MTRRAVFFDRDGVLIRHVDLLVRPEEVHLFPEAALALRRLRSVGFTLVVATNQPAIARGLGTEQDVARVHATIQRLLRSSGAGAIDRFYVCPHHPQATLPQYRMACECRKPRPGMLLQAARELGIDLRGSYMVGDRISDVIAGRRAGCRTILVESGLHLAPPIESPDPYDPTMRPDHVCADVAEAAEIILGARR